MKKISLLLAFVALCALCVHAQSIKTGYYFYDGARKEISVNTTAVLVYFNKAQISLDEINRIYTVEKEVRLNEQKADSLYAFVINIGNNNYDAAVAGLKMLPYVFDVEPVIGALKYTMVSNKFYVLLKSRADTSLLKTMALQTGATYEGPMDKSNEYESLWYGLSTNKNAANALDMSIVYGESGLLESVDPGFIYTIKCNVPRPSDILLDSQWSICNTNYFDVWAENILGDYVKIALIDDGVDITHPEFAGLTISGSMDYTTDPPSYPAQVYGSHATKVAGVIFANHYQHNIAGIAPNAELINISVFKPYDFSAPSIEALDEDLGINISYAIDYAVNTAYADIILCPWEFLNDVNGTVHSEYLEQALADAVTLGRSGKGCVVVFSAGNNGNTSYYDLPYPANCNEQFINVGAVKNGHERVDFSCYGDKLDIVAPGEEILTTATTENGVHGRVYADGTSLSAAHVAGVAALMLSANMDLTLSQVDWILKHTAYKSPDYTFGTYSAHPDGLWNDELGYGEVKINRAVFNAWNFSTEPGLVVKDNSSDNGVEPTTYSATFNSPSIVVKDATNSYEMDIVSFDGLYKVNVTLHNYGSSSVTIDPADVKLYYHTYSTEQLTWPQSFPYGSYLTPSSTTPVTIAGNGGSHTFVITLDLLNIIPAFQTGTWYITFAAVIGDGTNNEMHDYYEYNVPFDMFVEENRLVAGKTYINYEEPHIIIDPVLPPHPGINATPNPTDGHTTIGIDIDELPQNAMLVVTDMYGNVVARELLRGTSQEVDLGGRPTGNYYVYVVVGDKMIGMNKIVLY